MPSKAAKPGVYAVRKGNAPGIYLTWDECEQQVKGFTGAVFKKFPSEAEAQAWIAGVAPSSSSHQIATTSSSRTSANVGSSGSSSKPAAQDEDERGCIVVYCDGACKGNGKAGSVAGVGVWWGAGDPRNIAERCPGDQTNNRAELIGIVRVLETAPPSSRPLLIKTDSSYSISCIEVWFSKWVRNGFRTGGGERVKNQEIIRYISALIAARKKAGQEVRFKHVRGHVGIVGNEGADQLANLGAVMSVVPELNWGKLQEKVEASTEEDDEFSQFFSDDDEFTELAERGTNVTELVKASSPAPSVPPPAIAAKETKAGPSVAVKKDSRYPPPVVPPPRLSLSQSQHAHSTMSSRKERTGSALLLVKPPSVHMHDLKSTPLINVKKEGPKSRSPPTPVQSPASPPKKAKTNSSIISKEELETYADCLLDDDELELLGNDGRFDSDY